MIKVWAKTCLLASFFVHVSLGGCARKPQQGQLPPNTALTDKVSAVGSGGDRDSSASTTENLLRLANDIEARGSVATALPLYERAAAEADADSGVHALLGDAYIKLKRDNDAADAYRKALAKNPNNGRALAGLGGIFIRAKQIENALENLERAAPILNSPQVYDRLGIAYIMAGQPREALASFEEALALDRKDPDIATNAALAAALLGQDARAVALARETLTYRRVQLYHRRNLILILGMSGNTNEAKNAAAGLLDAGEIDALIVRAEKIRKISSPRERALALGTIRLA